VVFGNRGRVIDVVGHSDKVPASGERLGGGTVTIAPSEFDNLFVHTLRTPSATRIIKATYGEPRTGRAGEPPAVQPGRLVKS
jgi:hypothetical protein